MAQLLSAKDALFNEDGEQRRDIKAMRDLYQQLVSTLELLPKVFSDCSDDADDEQVDGIDSVDDVDDIDEVSYEIGASPSYSG